MGLFAEKWSAEDVKKMLKKRLKSTFIYLMLGIRSFFVQF